LTVFANADFKTIQWSWRGTLKIHAALIKVASMTGALELVFHLEPPRRIAEMRTFGKQSLESLFFAHDPNSKVLLASMSSLAAPCRNETTRRTHFRPRFES
jgi:hypothetical protein